MSIRAKTTSQAAHVMQLQKELADLKQAATATTLVDSVSTESTASETTPSFDSLSHTEKAAASLGVHPQAWKPIGNCARPCCPFRTPFQTSALLFL
jgi:hypothetical protein